MGMSQRLDFGADYKLCSYSLLQVEAVSWFSVAKLGNRFVGMHDGIISACHYHCFSLSHLLT